MVPRVYPACMRAREGARAMHVQCLHVDCALADAPSHARTPMRLPWMTARGMREAVPLSQLPARPGLQAPTLVAGREAQRLLDATEAVLGSRMDHPHVLRTFDYALVGGWVRRGEWREWHAEGSGSGCSMHVPLRRAPLPAGSPLCIAFALHGHRTPICPCCSVPLADAPGRPYAHIGAVATQ